MDEWMDGRMNGWVDLRTGGNTYVSVLVAKSVFNKRYRFKTLKKKARGTQPHTELDEFEVRGKINARPLTWGVRDLSLSLSLSIYI